MLSSLAACRSITVVLLLPAMQQALSSGRGKWLRWLVLMLVLLSGATCLATTAHAHADTRLKSLEAGCDEFLIKPLDVENLPNLIDHYLELSNENVE